MNLHLLTWAIAAVTARVVRAVDSPGIVHLGVEANQSTFKHASSGAGEPWWSDTWAGLSLTRTPDAAISFIQGNFIIPNITHFNKDNYLEIVLQFDGSLACHYTFLRAGIAINGNLPEADRYSTFWQFNNETQHLVESFPVSPGDEIGLHITPYSNSSARIEFYNARTGIQHVADSSSNTATCLMSADWVIEAFPSRLPPAPWDLYWTGMQWGTSDGRVWTAGHGQGPATEHLVSLMEPMVEHGNLTFVIGCYITDAWGPRPGLLRCNRLGN